MSADKTGGPAFPVPSDCGSEKGLTVRDYFAAKAMQAHLSIESTHEAIGQRVLSKEMLAEAFYAWADAMLLERQK